MAERDTLARQSAALTDWAFDAALPLWWTKGADPDGGFHDALTLDGVVPPLPRRARVQARQSYVYALAGKMGWQGPWRDACQHGVDFLLRHYRREDGLYSAAVTAAGAPGQDGASLYDQTFCLLAFAWVAHMVPQRTDLRMAARDLLDALSVLRHATGGFRENAAQPFQSNPHMHLLEAALAWMEFDGAPIWRDVAAEAVTLCLERFISPDTGAVREFFNDDWSAIGDAGGQAVEPGHQFEWAWLLERWHRHGGQRQAHDAALRLFHVGRRGIDTGRHVAIDSLNSDLSVKSSRARLWPQTERLKAAVILKDLHPDGAAQALDACIGLRRYFDAAPPGLWRDKMQLDGAFQDEPAPATSLYHILCAVDFLRQSCI